MILLQEVRALKEQEKKIAIFLCGCNGEVSKVIDLAALKDAVKGKANVVAIETHEFVCGPEGMQLIEKTLKSSRISTSWVMNADTPRAEMARNRINRFRWVGMGLEGAICATSRTARKLALDTSGRRPRGFATRRGRARPSGRDDP